MSATPWPATAGSPPRAYFFCVPTEERAEVPYQHLVVALAEGLTALGIACYANVDYWPIDPGRTTFLLRHDPAIAPADCALVIVSDDWFMTGNAMPEIVGRHAGCTIALDREDGSRLRSLDPAFRAFDYVLRTHYNRDTRYGANFVPWAYGLTERILASTALAAAPRRWELLANWRHTANPHSLRLDVERTFLPAFAEFMPIDDAREPVDAPPEDAQQRLWWRETGRRHWPGYYERLSGAAACACFGGYFVTRWPTAKESLASRVIKRVLARTHRRTNLISQWDSWRLWESFAAGCATVHVDLERYGCILPVMPVNWEHYIGIDLDRPRDAIARLHDDPGIVARVGAAGRAWARATYGPKAAAQRLLDLAGIPASR